MKQYFTGFFTAFCLTASSFLFMGSQNKNLGDIEVNSIKVRDAILISDHGVIFIGDPRGENCSIEKSKIQFRDENKTRRMTIGRGMNDYTYISLFNKKNKKVAYIGEMISESKSMFEPEDPNLIGAGGLLINDVKGKIVHKVNAWDLD